MSIVTVEFFCGLDLGQAGDFTALAVLERSLSHALRDPHRPAWSHGIRLLERFPPGTPYHAVQHDVAARFRQPPLEEATLVLDRTGVGKPVADAFRRAVMGAVIRPVVVTAGHTASYQHGCHHVPKHELAGVLQLVLQERRLKVAEELPHAQTLSEELLAFRPKPPSVGDDTVVSWRERPHDDLVFAVALAVWMAERERAAFPEVEPSRPAWWEDGPGWEPIW